MRTRSIISASVLLALSLIGTGSAYAEYYLYQPIPIVMGTEVINLGKIAKGATYSRYLTFTNPTEEVMRIEISSAQGVNIQNKSCVGASLFPGKSCQVVISDVVPLGAYEKKVIVKREDGVSLREYTIKAQGVNSTVALQAIPPTVDFGISGVNIVNTAHLELVNLSEEDVDASMVKAPSGVVLSGCDTIPAQQSCQFTLTWKPISATVLSGAISVNGAAVSYVTGASQRGEARWDTTSLTLKAKQGEVVKGSLTLTNIGNGELFVEDIQSGDTNVQVDRSQCPAKLAPNESCIIELSATAGSAAYSTQIKGIFQNSSATTSGIQLTVETESPASVVKTLTVLPSKTVLSALHHSQDTASISLQNMSEGTINVSGLQSSVPNLVILNPTNCIGSLAPNMACQVDVKYTAAINIENKPATITIVSDADNQPNQVDYTLMTNMAIWKTSSATLDFGKNYIPVNETKQLNITNTGNVASKPTLSATGVSLVGCNVVMAPGESCQLSISFIRTAPSLLNTALAITSTEAADAATVALTGEAAILPVADVVATTPSCVEVMVGQQATCYFDLQNKGTAAAVVSGVKALRAPEKTTVQADTCTANPLGVNNSCRVYFTRTETVAGDYREDIQYKVDEKTLEVSGTFTFNPYGLLTTASTPNVYVNSTGTGTITLQNNSKAALTGFTYTAPAGFSVTAHNCGTTLAANASCQMTVSYQSATPTTLKGDMTFKFKEIEKVQALEVNVISPEISITTPMGMPSVITGFSNSGVLRRVHNQTTQNITVGVAVDEHYSTVTNIPATNTQIHGMFRFDRDITRPNNSFLISATGQTGIITYNKGCTQGVSLAPGEFCDYVEHPEDFGTNGSSGLGSRTVTNQYAIQTTFGTIPVSTTFNVVTPSATLLPYNNIVYPGTAPDVQIEVSNPSADNLGITINGTAISNGVALLKANSCGDLTTLPANKTCILTVQNTKNPSVYLTMPFKVSDVSFGSYIPWYGSAVRLNQALIKSFVLTTVDGTTGGDWQETDIEVLSEGTNAEATQRYVNSGTLTQTLAEVPSFVGTVNPNTFYQGNNTCTVGKVLQPGETCETIVGYTNPSALDNGNSTQIKVGYTVNGKTGTQYATSEPITLKLPSIPDYITSPVGTSACVYSFSMTNTGGLVCSNTKQALATTGSCPSGAISGNHSCDVMVPDPIAIGSWTSPIPAFATSTVSGAGFSDYKTGDVSNSSTQAYFFNTVSVSGNKLIFPAQKGEGQRRQGYADYWYLSADIWQYDYATKNYTLLTNVVPAHTNMGIQGAISPIFMAAKATKNGGYWLKTKSLAGDTSKNPVTYSYGAGLRWQYVQGGSVTGLISNQMLSGAYANLFKYNDQQMDAGLYAEGVDPNTGDLYMWEAVNPNDNTKPSYDYTQKLYKVSTSGAVSTINLPAIGFKIRTGQDKYGTHYFYEAVPELAGSITGSKNSTHIEAKNGIVIRGFHLVPHLWGAYTTGPSANSVKNFTNADSKLLIYAINTNVSPAKMALIKIVNNPAGSSVHYHLAHEYDGNLYFNDGTMNKWSDIIKAVQ